MRLVLQLLMMSGLALDTRGVRDDYVTVDLRYGLVAGYSPYISFVRTPWLPPDYSGHACSYQAVLRVSLAGPYKGAKLELDYGEPPRLWTLDVSDSPASDGYGGHNGTTSDMAEAHIHNRQLRVYGSGVPDNVEQSTNGDHLLRVLDDVVKKGSRMWLDVSDERLEIGGPKGVASNQVLESPYLFDFSGQKVHQGAREHDLYISLNRVIGSDHRAGSGLCKVEISLYEFGK